MNKSNFWVQHFKQNLEKQRIDWTLKPMITRKEKSQILYSLQAWQLGETSDGKNLLSAASKYSKQVNDPTYLEAVKLFIKEEQKHGENLGRYIDLIGEKRKRKDWGDSLFRKIRYLNQNMELWTITVIIVESAAQIFYQALHDATHCKLLQSICLDIIKDEAHHIKFQNERMQIMFSRKKTYMQSISLAFYSVLFYGTMHAVWFGHKKALQAGGVNKSEFIRQMFYKFCSTLKYIHGKPTTRLFKKLQPAL